MIMDSRFWVLFEVAPAEKIICTKCGSYLYIGSRVYMTLDDATESRVTGKYCTHCTPEIIKEAFNV